MDATENCWFPKFEALQGQDTTYRVCCTAVDRAENVMKRATCRLLEETVSVPRVTELMASCAGEGMAKFVMTATRPGNVSWIVSRNDTALPDFNANSSLLFDPAAVTGGAAHGHLTLASPGTKLSFGACGLDANAAYALHVAVQDLADPALHSNASVLSFSMQTLCAQPEEAECDADALLHPLQPRLRVTSGPGLMVGASSLQPKASGLSIVQVCMLFEKVFVILFAVQWFARLV
jgi:hypothetical protein